MDTEETEGCALQGRPYSVRSRNCVMFGITGTRGGEIPEKKKKKQPTSHDVTTGIPAK